MSDRSLPDRELVARAQGGDLRASDHLVERHYEAVYRVALGVMKDPDAAADVTQDAFLKAIRALTGFRGEASFKTWIIRITMNEAKGALRKRARRREDELEEEGVIVADDPNLVERIAVRDEADRVRVHLAALPEKQRLAVTLRIEEGLSFREIGDIIDSSEGAARVNYHHGVRRLREMLGDVER